MKSNRRRLLTAFGTGALAFTAGCTGQFLTDDEEDAKGNRSRDNYNNTKNQAALPALDHGEVVDDFEDLEDWVAIEGKVNADKEAALTGSQSPRIENAGNVAGMFRAYPDGLDISGHNLSLALQVDTPRPARVTVQLLAPGQSDQLQSTRTVVSSYEGWLRMDVGYTGQRGEPNLKNIQELRITLQTSEEAEIRFWVDDMRMTPQASQGYVMLTFDDTVASQYENAFPLLKDRDMQGVGAIVPDSLNRENRLTIDQLREMRDAGWDISSHPEGESFRELDPEGIRKDIEDAQKYLNNRGFPDGARHIFVPYHNTNQEIVDITREYHELSSYFGGTTAAVPFTDPMHLSRTNMHDLSGFTDLIDFAAEYNQLAIGLAHGVVDKSKIKNDPLADMTTQQLTKLLDYIKQSDVQVVTASDLVDNQDSL